MLHLLPYGEYRVLVHQSCFWAPILALNEKWDTVQQGWTLVSQTCWHLYSDLSWSQALFLLNLVLVLTKIFCNLTFSCHITHSQHPCYAQPSIFSCLWQICPDFVLNFLLILMGSVKPKYMWYKSDQLDFKRLHQNHPSFCNSLKPLKSWCGYTRLKML